MNFKRGFLGNLGFFSNRVTAHDWIRADDLRIKMFLFIVIDLFDILPHVIHSSFEINNIPYKLSCCSFP